MNKFTREFLESLTFRIFDEFDWMEFSGCENNFPLIARTDDDEIVIIDGETISVYFDSSIINSSGGIIGYYAETNKGRELKWNSF